MAEQEAGNSSASSHTWALPRSAVRILAACARGDQLCPELELHDVQAGALFERLGGNADSFGVGELRCAAFRTWVVDELTRRFFAHHPQGVGVSLWPMLGTRAHRLSEHDWVDLDARPLAALRARFLPPRRGWTQLASCLGAAPGVQSESVGARPRVFVLDESVLPLCTDVVMRALDVLSMRAPAGSELIVAFTGHATFRRAGAARVLELEPCRRGGEVARYPRLRFVEPASYGEDLQHSFRGVNEVARLQGNGAPALAHLQVV